MEKKILVVDDQPNNLQVLRQVLKSHYQLIFAHNGQKAIQASQNHRPDLILLDIMMPEMDGYEVCRELKNNPVTVNIPVIFVTAMDEVEDETLGFEVGAVDYIAKPISAPIVISRIKNQLSLVRAKALEESQRDAISMLGEAGHYNDTDTGVHTWRMAAYAKELAIAAGWPGTLTDWLELAAPMHDTGKIGIPDSILKAPRKLTIDEWNIMKTHAEIGYGILRRGHSPIFTMAAEIAYYHHERWDGSGYPFGIAGENIPESARFVAIADVFDALTMKRPYKEAWTVNDAIAEIKRSSGTQFEPRLVELFEQILPRIIEIKKEWDKKEQQQLPD